MPSQVRFPYLPTRMPLSEEEEAELGELKNDIKAVKNRIKIYEANVPEDEVTLDKHVDYLTLLTKQLTEYESAVKELKAKASVEGK